MLLYFVENKVRIFEEFLESSFRFIDHAPKRTEKSGPNENQN